ncbi:MAG: hypothetical protein M3019_00955 [Candidatus Dormibacteraeota bacterium]|nr:hypothetical protein [Candidatus Dormibacteraeota bacterium]
MIKPTATGCGSGRPSGFDEKLRTDTPTAMMTLASDAAEMLPRLNINAALRKRRLRSRCSDGVTDGVRS